MRSRNTNKENDSHSQLDEATRDVIHELQQYSLYKLKQDEFDMSVSMVQGSFSKDNGKLFEYRLDEKGRFSIPIEQNNNMAFHRLSKAPNIEELATNEKIILTSYLPITLHMLGLILHEPGEKALVIRIPRIRKPSMRRDGSTSRAKDIWTIIDSVRDCKKLDIAFDDAKAIENGTFALLSECVFPMGVKNQFTFGNNSDYAYRGDKSDYGFVSDIPINQELADATFISFIMEWFHTFMYETFIQTGLNLMSPLTLMPGAKIIKVANFFLRGNSMPKTTAEANSYIDSCTVNIHNDDPNVTRILRPPHHPMVHTDIPIDIRCFPQHIQEQLDLLDKASDIVRIWDDLAYDAGLSLRLPQKVLKSDDVDAFIERLNDFGERIGAKHYENAYWKGIPYDDLIIDLVDNGTRPNSPFEK